MALISALTIAGSDPSGGAGIQADLKAFAASGVYGLSVVTALTAQNSEGVQFVWPSQADQVAQQIASLRVDLPIHAVKTGMLADVASVALIAESMPACPLVIDPVLRVTQGAIHSNSAIESQVRQHLWPKAALLTPNAREAAALLSQSVTSVSEMLAAADALLRCGLQAVLLKGGHVEPYAKTTMDLLLISGADPIWFTAPRIAKKTHGTGCVLSALITAQLALGLPLPAACSKAHADFHRFLADARPIGVAERASPDPFSVDYRDA